MDNLGTYLLNKYPYLSCKQCYSLIKYLKTFKADDIQQKMTKFIEHMQSTTSPVGTTLPNKKTTKLAVKNWMVDNKINLKKSTSKFRKLYKIVSRHERQLLKNAE